MAEYSMRISDFEQGGFYVNNGREYSSTTEIRSGQHELFMPRSIRVDCPGYQWSFVCFNASGSFTSISASSGYKDSGTVIDLSSFAWIRYIRVELHSDGGIAPPAACELVYTYAWHSSEGSFPVNDELIDPPEKAMARPFPHALWRIDAGKNSGFPYHKLLIMGEDIHVRPVKQRNYICVYDSTTSQNSFTGNGLAVLTPSSCTETEILNGAWTVSLTHPIDKEGRWQYLLERNILKVEGQLFTIVNVEHSWQGNSGSVSVQAEHIFYQQNDSWIYPNSRITGETGSQILNSIDINTERNAESGQTLYNFTHSSDLDIPEGVSTNKWNPITGGCTPIEIILGESGLANTCSGELYRDNFYFSVNKRMEHANENAFDIRVGHNLKGIRRTVDTSTMCAYFRAYDSYGGWFAISWNSALLPRVFPHSIIRSKNFSFNIDEATLPAGWSIQDKIDRSAKLLSAEAISYFYSYCAPLVSYVVDIEDISNNPDFSDLSGHYDYKVGNQGRLTDERLGGSVWLKITKTVKDRIANKVTQVTFGDLRSFTRPSGYHTAIASLTPIPVRLADQVRDKSGNLCFDRSGNQIIQRSDD